MALASMSKTAAIWLLVVCSGCGADPGDSSTTGDSEAWPAPAVETASAPVPFRVGVVVDRSGTGRHFGERFATGFAAGLRHGEGLLPEVRVIDDRGRASVHAAALRELVRSDCVAIAGGQRGIGGIVGHAALADAEVLWWASPAGMAATMTAPSIRPLRPDLAVEIEWLISRLQTSGTDLDRLGLVVARDAHGQELLWHAAAALRRRGVDGPRWHWRLGNDSADAASLIVDMEAAPMPPTTIVCGLDDGGTVAAITALRGQRSTARLVCLSGVAIEEVADELGQLAAGVVWLQCVPVLAADDPVRVACLAAGVADAPACEGWLAGRALRAVLTTVAPTADRAAVIAAASEIARDSPDLLSWVRAFGGTSSGGPFWSVVVVDGTTVLHDLERATGGR